VAVVTSDVTLMHICLTIVRLEISNSDFLCIVEILSTIQYKNNKLQLLKLLIKLQRFISTVLQFPATRYARA
jgi:hypothetical protein